MPEVKQIHSAAEAAPEDQGEVVDLFAALRLPCPDCRQPVALTHPSAVLPRHAVCPTWWNPFGLSECPGSGLPLPAADGSGRVLEAVPDRQAAPSELPDGLDWRLQPFSHAGGPGSRPLRTPGPRRPSTEAPRAA